MYVFGNFLITTYTYSVVTTDPTQLRNSYMIATVAIRQNFNSRGKTSARFAVVRVTLLRTFPRESIYRAVSIGMHASMQVYKLYTYMPIDMALDLRGNVHSRVNNRETRKCFPPRTVHCRRRRFSHKWSFFSSSTPKVCLIRYNTESQGAGYIVE